MFLVQYLGSKPMKQELGKSIMNHDIYPQKLLVTEDATSLIDTIIMWSEKLKQILFSTVGQILGQQ